MGHLEITLILTNNCDAHQKHERHSKKSICLALPSPTLSLGRR